MGKEKKEKWADDVARKLAPKELVEVPLTLVIPTYNVSEKIAVTLNSIASQNYKTLELIIVDGGSLDRTLDIVEGFGSLITRIYRVSRYNLSQMANQGVAVASSQYISFLAPGSFYISPLTLHTFAVTVKEHSFPDLVYCGYLRRGHRNDEEYISGPIEQDRLKKGIFPSSLSSMWFRRDIMSSIGKFNPSLQVRTGLDFLCRLEKIPDRRLVAINRIFVDVDVTTLVRQRYMRAALEVGVVIRRNYGWGAYLKYILAPSHFLFLRFFWAMLKQQLFRTS